MSDTSPIDARPETRTEALGLLYAVLAYGWWGAVPIFWKQLTHVPADELLAQRMAWGFVVFAALLIVRGRVRDMGRALRARRTLAVFAVSSALLACNWLTFIYAMATERVLQASLGYFLNPLVSVFLGMLVIGERLRPAQWLAMALSVVGVLQLATQSSEFPWISLVLACSFGLYGLVRKIAPIDALLGSTLEAGMAAPPALAYIAFLALAGRGHFTTSIGETELLLAATGIITACPLLWFANAARRLPLTTLGFLQYLAPTGHFLLAVFVYGEPFTPLHLRAFACIWIGVAVFSTDLWTRRATTRPSID